MENLLRDLTQALDGQSGGMRRPFVTISYAQSIDGSLTPWPGRPFAISSPETKDMTHAIRACHDAILIGSGTLLADDPRLTTRRAEGDDPQPVVLDSRLRFPLEARLLQQNRHPWIVTTPSADPARKAALITAGAEVIEVAAGREGHVSLKPTLEALAERGIRSVMVEGGAAILTAFLSESLADWMALTITPRFLGGLTAVSHLPVEDAESFPRVLDMKYTEVGGDLVLWGAFHS